MSPMYVVSKKYNIFGSNEDDYLSIQRYLLSNELQRITTTEGKIYSNLLFGGYRTRLGDLNLIWHQMSLCLGS